MRYRKRTLIGTEKKSRISGREKRDRKKRGITNALEMLGRYIVR